ncbi:unnamed protein product [Merluccius merluccius]
MSLLMQVLVLEDEMEMRTNAMMTAEFVYDPLAKKLRMRSTQLPGLPLPGFPLSNSSRTLDLLMLFDEGFFYEIDSKNQSCEKKVLHSAASSMDISPDATFASKITLGSETEAAEGLTLNVWMGSVPEIKGTYVTSVTMGSMPVSTAYFSSTSIISVSHLQVETEIKDPEKLAVPSFCEGEVVEDGAVHSFFNLLF